MWSDKAIYTYFSGHLLVYRIDHSHKPVGLNKHITLISLNRKKKISIHIELNHENKCERQSTYEEQTKWNEILFCYFCVSVDKSHFSFFSFFILFSSWWIKFKSEWIISRNRQQNRQILLEMMWALNRFGHRLIPNENK